MFKKSSLLFIVVVGLLHSTVHASLIGPYVKAGAMGFDKRADKKEGWGLVGVGCQITRVHALTCEGAFGSSKSRLGQSVIFGYQYLFPLKYNFNVYIPHLGAAFQPATQSWIPFIAAGMSWYPNPKTILDVSGKLFVFIDHSWLSKGSSKPVLREKNSTLPVLTITLGRYFF